MVDERGLVREFHAAFDVPVNEGPPDLALPDDRLRMRYRLVAEEFAELTGAILGPAARAVVEQAVDDASASPTDGADLVDRRRDRRPALRAARPGARVRHPRR